MPEFSQIWIVSFGARWIAGDGWVPAFLVARELTSQQSIALERTDLSATSLPPYPTGNSALLVCFVGEAVAGCHIRLGWPPPTCMVCLKVEFRNHSNGLKKPCGDGLIGALFWYGLPISGVVSHPDSIMHGACDLAAIERLFLAMRSRIDLPRAILRSRYLVAVARIEATGLPIDHLKLTALKRHWRNIVRTMGAAAFETNPTGLDIGSDARHRARLRPFSSCTGRNQPRSGECLMAAPGWLRKLIRPGAGKGLALIDWAQQEFGIAAALSGDQRMLADYQSGDPYLALAERYGGDRDVFKACAIGVLNGMGTSGLARRIKRNASEARLMLQEHRATYPAFWRWSDNIERHAFLHGRLQSVFGWGVVVNTETNPRFLRNFPMQANGAEMLRLACSLATEKGVTVCTPNHDALLIEAPLEDLADAVKTIEAAMAEASEIVLDGFPLRTSVTTIRYPDHYPHPKSDAL